jgi:tRNA (guanine37-N1)-methyltransferase
MAEKNGEAGSRCLRVPKGRAEAVRRRLLELGLLRKDLQPARFGDDVYLPLNAGDYHGEGEICEARFKPVRSAPRSYQALADVPETLRPLLPRAFDVIGRVIVIKIPEELQAYRQKIGRALLQARPEALSVAVDKGVKGEDRIRELEVVAGSPSLETVHVEHGLRFILDPSRVYFSPRLATERSRVARMVAGGEAVLDMFSGVGPFAIHIAKRAMPSKVFAADINPAAIEYLKRNVRLNRVFGVEPILGDARELPGKIPAVDRIIMNLPHSASEFLPTAMRLLRPGGTVHLYDLLEPGEKDRRSSELASIMKNGGREPGRISARLVRGYSAISSHFVFDIIVH